MAESLPGDTANTAVSQEAVTNKRRDVLTKQANAGQETVVASEPRRRDGGSLDVITDAASDLGSPAHTDRSALPTTIRSFSLFRALRRWYLFSALRLLLAECRSLGYRMAVTLERRRWELRGYTGPVPTWWNLTGVSGCQSYRHAYIRYTQQIQKELPWLSISDLLLVARAWRGGSEWDSHTCTLRNQDNHSCVHRETCNFKPPQAVQQSSKCDRSVPPASQG